MQGMPEAWANIVYFRRSLKEWQSFAWFSCFAMPPAAFGMVISMHLFPAPSGPISDAQAIYMVLALLGVLIIGGGIGAIIGSVCWKKLFVPRYLKGFKERHGPITSITRYELKYLYSELSVGNTGLGWIAGAWMTIIPILVLLSFFVPQSVGGIPVSTIALVGFMAGTIVIVSFMIKREMGVYAWADAHAHILPDIIEGSEDEEGGCC